MHRLMKMFRDEFKTIMITILIASLLICRCEPVHNFFLGYISFQFSYELQEFHVNVTSVCDYGFELTREDETSKLN